MGDLNKTQALVKLNRDALARAVKKPDRVFALREARETLSDAVRAAVDATLEGTGCETLFV